jgi:hypothetical protein
MYRLIDVMAMEKYLEQRAVSSFITKARVTILASECLERGRLDTEIGMVCDRSGRAHTPLP